MMPLHKGMDNFMSGKQFETFYWPTFKKVMMGLINEGCIPMPFAEGLYNNRLEIIKDLPRASVIWYFEATDMARAKKVLGNRPALPVISRYRCSVPARQSKSKSIARNSSRPAVRVEATS
jgi:hypothetical protein